MEDSILKQLYNGQIYPPEQYTPSSPEYHQKSKVLSEYYQSLSSELAGLDPSLPDKLEELFILRNSLCSTEVEEMYLEGFRLGVKMMAEVFTDTKQNKTV